MKRLPYFLSGILVFTLSAAFAGEAPRGSLLELHSCELFAGGCVVSAESTMGRHYMLRAWDFTGGEFNGTDLKGLQVAVLQSAPENLAAQDARSSGEAVVYLPQTATRTQRDALLAWLESSQKDFHPTRLQTRVVPLQFAKSEKSFAFSAGNFVSVKTASFDSCPIGSCGDALWYEPRTPTSLFTVAVNDGSHVTEPLLKLKWNDADRRTIFLGRFGEPDTAKNLYVTMSELCGHVKNVF